MKNKTKLILLDKLNFFILWLKKNKKYSLVFPEIGINLGCEQKTNEYFRGVDGSFLIFLMKFKILPSRLKKKIYLKTCTSEHMPFVEYYNKLKKIKIIHHNLNYNIPFEDNSIQFIFSSNFLEHFNDGEGKKLLEECYRVLIKDGELRLIVPDLDVEAKKMKQTLLNYQKTREANLSQKYLTINPKDKNDFSFHKKMYNFEELKKVLGKIGFKSIEKLSSFKGNFPHVKDLDPTYGLFVQASK